MSNKQLQTTQERAYSGCIVTLVEVRTGEERVEHASGYSNDTREGNKRIYKTLSMFGALKRLLDEVDTWEGEWKVRTISTPATILADLNGRQHGNDGARPTPPEAAILTHVGRADLWEGHHASERHKNARARRRAAAA